MNIRNALAKEHSKALTNKICRYVGKKTARFSELMEIFLGKERTLAQRAAWAVSYCVINNPPLAKPYFKKIISLLNSPNNHPAINRNIVRLLQFVDIPERYIAAIADICFKFLSEHEQPIAVKAFSMSVLANICKKHPEMKNELTQHIKFMLEQPHSPGIKARAKKTLLVLDKL